MDKKRCTVPLVTLYDGFGAALGIFCVTSVVTAAEHLAGCRLHLQGKRCPVLGLRKVSGNGLKPAQDRGWRCLMVLTKSGGERQSPVWVCVLEGRVSTEMWHSWSDLFPALGFFLLCLFLHTWQRGEK